MQQCWPNGGNWLGQEKLLTEVFGIMKSEYKRDVERKIKEQKLRDQAKRK